MEKRKVICRLLRVVTKVQLWTCRHPLVLFNDLQSLAHWASGVHPQTDHCCECCILASSDAKERVVGQLRAEKFFSMNKMWSNDVWSTLKKSRNLHQTRENLENWFSGKIGKFVEKLGEKLLSDAKGSFSFIDRPNTAVKIPRVTPWSETCGGSNARA